MLILFFVPLLCVFSIQFLLPSSPVPAEIADLNKQLFQLWANNRNPSIKEIKNLLEKGAQIEAVDDHKRTSLHIAAQLGYEEIVECLIQYKASIEAKDAHGRTPLHRAALWGRINAVECLIKNKASINARDNNDWTPLHQAAFWSQTEVIEYLVGNGASIDVCSVAGETPLHIAVREKCQRAVEVLVKNGALVNVKDNLGRTPIDLAREKGLEIIAECLSAPLRERKSVSIGMKAGGICLLASSLIYGQYESKNRIEQGQIENQSFMKKLLLFLKRKKLSATLGVVGTGLVTASFFAK